MVQFTVGIEFYSFSHTACVFGLFVNIGKYQHFLIFFCNSSLGFRKVLTTFF
jgi:hypothetical protein